MENRDQAEKILREMGHAMGLRFVGQMGEDHVLLPCPDVDAWEARLHPMFKGTAVGRNARPLARVRLAHQDIADATPEILLALVTNACVAAKADIVAQLREALARLEALP